MLRLRLLPCVLATAAAAKTVDWEGMHPSSGANTKSADAGETVTFNWDETHDVWLMPDEAAYNSCTFTNAVEIHSTEAPGKTGRPQVPGKGNPGETVLTRRYHKDPRGDPGMVVAPR